MKKYLITSDCLKKIKEKNDLDYEADSLTTLEAYLSYGDQMGSESLSNDEQKQIGFLGVSVSICEHSKRSFYEKAGLFRLRNPQ